MAIARWNPTNELSSLRTTMDRLFGELMEDGMQAPSYRLPVDITETDDRYVIRAPVPGFEPDEVDITVADGVLGIMATHKEDKEEKEGRFIRREVAFGNYMRQIALPGDVKGEDVQADFENGVLTIEIPRARRPRPVRVEVKRSERRSRREDGQQGSQSGSEQRQPAAAAGSQKK
jgi:HSP20 family protein